MNSRPNIFFIEPTNVCDLKCELCPTNREMKREKGYMQFSTFKTIVDYISDTYKDEECFINIWGWGEPLLHDRIFDMINYVSGNNIKTRISTNFNFISETQIDEICNSSLDSIIIGLDGINESSHQKYRIGSNIKQLKINIEKLVNRRKELNIGNPNIVITTLITSLSENEISEIIKYCKNIGVEALLLKYPNLWRNTKTNKVIRDNYNKFIKDVSIGSRYTLDTKGNIRSTDGYCPFIEMNGIFLYDGSLSVCCFDFEGENSLGTIDHKESILKIYDSSVWQNAKFQMNKKSFNICTTCDSSGQRRKIYLFKKNGDDEFLAGL